jgi:hypothetical protein
VVGFPTGLLWIISNLCPLLVPISGKNGRVKIQCIIIKLKVAKKPLIQVTEYFLVNRLGKFIEISLESFAACHPFPTKKLF